MLLPLIGRVLFGYYANKTKVYATPGHPHTHWIGVPGEEYVHKLTEGNVDSFIRDNQFVLIFFYSPHCPHCQMLIPEYSKAARILNKYNPDVKMAALDVIKYRIVQIKFNLSDVPTINFYMNGKFQGEYTHPGRSADIVTFIRRYAPQA